jgi:hypothetical protein
MPCETDPGLVSHVVGVRSRAGRPVRQNPILRLSFCPIHGFASELRPVRPTGYARAHAGPG